MVIALAQAAAGAAVVARLARGRRRRPPLAAAPVPPGVSVVIPARDEERRIGGVLAGLAGEPAEVIVVDDGSRDRTADVARAHGARVVAGAEPPEGWIGKPWALQQGLEAASGDIVVSLDADTRPRPGLLGALAGALRDADLVTASARFVCDSAAERVLHPSMLASLVYRYGPSDVEAPGRILSNGQVTAVRRQALLDAGGYALAAGHMTDDAALARALAARGWRVTFADGTALVDVRMYDSAGETWREWGRSLALPDVTPPAWQAADLAVVWLTMALPVARAAALRPTRLDVALLALRGLLLAPLAPAYARRGAPYWASPLADPATAVRLTLSALRPARTWRGRTYPAGTARR
jgi:dolichol-phosphate mannosyltransferase